MFQPAAFANSMIRSSPKSQLTVVPPRLPCPPFAKPSALVARAAGGAATIKQHKRAVLVGVGLGLLVNLLPKSLSACCRSQGLPPLQHGANTPTSASSQTVAKKHTEAMRDMNTLVDYLKEEGVIQTPAVEHAMRMTDRGCYVSKNLPKMYAYQDSPQPIGLGETISAPHMHAHCLELLRDQLKPGARVLDVGSGSGYLAAAMAVMVEPDGKVVGIEKHSELTQLSIEHVRKAAPHLLESGILELRSGNVLGGALEGEEPFDAIHVGAAAAKLPDVLVQKLKPGARMVIPVGAQWDFQVMKCIEKDMDGRIKKRDLMWVRYVPLTEPGQDEE